MQSIYRRFSVTTGFLLLLIVLIANAFITRHQLSVQVDNQNRATRSRQVLLELSRTESLLEDAESGQRGYLYTGNPKYLAPYNQAVTEVAVHLRDLAHLTTGNPYEQARIPELQTLSQEKLAELAQTIAYFQSGHPNDAKALVLSDRGRLLMERIHGLMGDMTQQETSLQTVRIATSQASIQRTFVSIFLVTCIAVFGSLFLAYYILHVIALRDRHARHVLEREEWFRSTLTSLGDAVITTDETGRVTFLNPIAEQLMGTHCLQVMSQPIENVFPIFNESSHRPVENPVRKVVALGSIVGLANHTVLQRSDGALIPIEDSAAPIRDSHGNLIGAVLVFRDATRERQAQELLRKTEKLAAAARLSATVAHEINNPLEAIGNLIYLVKTTDGLPAVASAHLALVEQELARVSHITRQTLGFYRESTLPNRIDLPELVESVLKIYSNRFGTRNITIQRDFQDCPPIHGLAGELNQAIANLISNAIDAAPHGGTVHVRLSCLETAAGQTVQISVEDDGAGIAAEHKDRIFEPFFTTKKDVGTGLGLWVTKQIIDRHSGSIHVNSRNEAGSSGTIFNVFLPVVADSRPSATPEV